VRQAGGFVAFMQTLFAEANVVARAHALALGGNGVLGYAPCSNTVLALPSPSPLPGAQYLLLVRPSPSPRVGFAPGTA
jgi:hypothetical protein